jgi:hypothetical protein
MFRLEATAYKRLSDEALMVAEQFLGALPPYARQQLHSVRLFGVQARRFDPEAPFELLIVADQDTWAVKTGISIAVSAVESSGLYTAHTTLATTADLAQPTALLRRTLQNADREGLELWRRAQDVAATSA